MSVRIITDSASDLPRSHAENITVLPMTVTFGEAQYRDGVDLTSRKFYELLVEEDALPVTSQINPDRFSAAFREAVDAGDTVLCILLSSKLSGTYQSANIAAEDFPGKVFLVDSANATIGEAILVQRAEQLVNEGMTAQEIAAILEQEKLQIRLLALLDTLEYLKKGGRLSAQAAFIGGMLSIKPVITIADGEVSVLEKARGSKNGNNLLIQEIAKGSGIDFSRPFALGYTGLNDALLQKYIADSEALWAGHVSQLPVFPVGATIGTHAGPGAIAVAFFQT